MHKVKCPLSSVVEHSLYMRVVGGSSPSAGTMTDYLSKKIRNISFLGILFVFLQHSINFTGYIDPATTFIGQGNINAIIQYIIGYGVARPAVALFFLLSGYLFFRNFNITKTFEKYRSRIKTLFVPYILWNSLAILSIIIFQLVFSDYFPTFYTGYLPGKSLLTYLQMIYNHGVAFQLWFLRDLMLYTLFAPIIYIAVRYIGIVLLIPLCLFWLIRIPLPSFFSFLDRGGLFYLVGVYLAMHPISISQPISKKLFTFTGILWFIILIVKTYIAFFSSGLTSYLSILDNIAIVLGLFTIWFGYDTIAQSKIVAWFGNQALFTFFIYAAHEPLLEILKYIGITIIGRNNTTLLVCYFLVPIVTYTFCISIAKYLQRYTASIYKILTGGR